MAVTLAPLAEETRCDALEFTISGIAPGVGNGTVVRVWREHGIQPWRV